MSRNIFTFLYSRSYSPLAGWIDTAPSMAGFKLTPKQKLIGTIGISFSFLVAEIIGMVFVVNPMSEATD